MPSCTFVQYSGFLIPIFRDLKWKHGIAAVVNVVQFPLEEAIKDIAWKELGDRRLCDPCLGRLTGHLGHGMSNEERGTQLRQALGLAITELCWLCDGLVTEVDKFAGLVLKSMEGLEWQSFLIGSRIAPDVAAREEELWTAVGSVHAEPLKTEINREVGKKIESFTGRPAEFEHPDIVALIDTAFDAVQLQVTSLYIYGRYRKLVRGIPQTKWPCKRCRGKGCEHCGGKGKMYESSVEEVIANVVMEQSGGTGHALHGLGREDIDARMLGSGRPFIVEILNPRRRSIDLVKVEIAVNSSGTVEVSDLKFTNRKEVVALKDRTCDKTYRILIRLSSPTAEEKVKKGIASLLASPVAQRTPIRVSHRRADKVRERRIKGIDMTMLEGSLLELVIRAEAGSYVKELVHGDQGRTEPSLAGILGVPCEVLELDVLEVHDGE
jgi:tRNA pseudouridine synthase 10